MLPPKPPRQKTTPRLLDLPESEWTKEIQRLQAAYPYSKFARKWTAKEVAVLKALYGKVPTKVIGEQLGRSAKTIQWKIRDLHLKTGALPYPTLP